MNHHSALPPLDSSSALPLYRQLRDGIQGLLSSGVWDGDTPIPSERDLTESLRVSRATVRQAIQELELEGWLVRHQGRGTFAAAQRIEQPLKRITGFSENMRSVGLEAGSKLVSARLEPALPAVARALRLAIGMPVAVVTRLRLAGGAPLMLERAHLNYALTPGLLERDLTGSLYDLLTSVYRLKFARGEETSRRCSRTRNSPVRWNWSAANRSCTRAARSSPTTARPSSTPNASDAPTVARSG